MDIRSSLEGLKSILGTAPEAPAVAGRARGGSAAGGSGLGGDVATLSSAASEVSSTASDSGVRMEKVAGIQAALAAGSYGVPAQAVASKLVDAMLGGQQ